MALKSDTIWLIAYVNRKFIKSVEEELSRYDYEDVEAYIPTVKLLKKKFKNKEMFEFVPLLFNYGFFKVPYEKACDPDFLSSLRHRITCIYGWVSDPASTLATPELRPDNEGFIDAMPQAAVATDKEVAHMVKASQSMSIFNSEDLKQFKPGDFIKLEGYPFEGMPAEIVRINHKKGEVLVKLHIEEITKQVTVSFENVFYTIYKNFREESRESSSDEITEKYGNNTIDHITFKKGMHNGQ